MNSRRKKVFRLLNIFFQFFLLFFTLLPIYFLIISSFKTNPQILQNYFWITFPIHFENYARAFNRVMYYLLNSTVVCTITVVAVSILSCVTSYVFAKFEFYGKKVLFMVILSFLMIPSILTLIPQFILIANMKLIGSKLALILPYAAWGQITFIFVLRTFIEEIPDDLFSCAKLDGANDIMTFRHIVFPIAKPMITSLALLNFLGNWNDLIWPSLVLHKDKSKTVTVGLYAFTGVQNIQYGLLFAGFVISSLPVVILFTVNMKYFIQGITSGAIKA